LIQNKRSNSIKKGVTQIYFQIYGSGNKVYLLPEFKSRLFSKIENNEDALSVSNIQILLNTIDNVSTVYSVDTIK
jgi:hypothetical protein